MLCKLFAAILCASLMASCSPLMAQPPIQIKIQDGSTLSFPAGFDQVVRPKAVRDQEIVIGLQTKSQVRVVFVHSHEKIPFQPEKILAEALSLERIHLQPLDQGFVQGIHRNPINRIITESGYNHLFLAFDRRYYHGGSAFFFLMGSDSDFFEFVPIFENMVDQFEPGKPKFDFGMREVPVFMILAAIVILGLNVWMIFKGFKEMASLQT